MADVTIRNPRARVAFWLSIAAGFVVLALNQHERNAVVLLLGAAAAYALAGWVSFWRKLTLRPGGFDARDAIFTQRYVWHQVEDVRVISRHRSVNLIPTFVLRYVQITVNGNEIDLPAPRAGRFLGRHDFARQAALFHEIWCARTGRVARRS